MTKKVATIFFAMAILAIAGFENQTFAQFNQKPKKKVPEFKQYAWTGSMDKHKIPVFIWLEENADGILAGEIVYTGSTSKTPIRIMGRAIQYPESDHVTYSLAEFWGKKGQQTGYMSFAIDSVGKASGTWHFFERDLDLVLDSVVPFPAGKGGLLRPLTQQQIGGKKRTYEYFYRHPYKSQLGGTVIIEQIEHKYLRFDISVNDPNIAEGNNFADYNRTILNGNRFEYIMRECNYGFDAVIFEDFMVITSKSNEPSDCFGFGSSFEGIYLEQK